MKIAIVRPDYHTLPETFCHKLKKAGLEVDLVIPESNFSQIYDDVNIIQLKRVKKLFGTTIVKNVQKILRENHYDLINVGEETQYISTAFAIAAIRNRIPFAITNERYKFSSSTLYSVMSKMLYHSIIKFLWKRAYALIPHTLACKSFLLSLNAPKNKLFHIPVGVDSKIFFNKGTRKYDKLRIITVARLIEHKGLYDLFKALKLLKNEGYNFECTLIGSGYLYSSLKRFALNLDIDNCIRWISYVSYKKLNNYYNNANVFVLPSYTEVIGMSALEAMATGLPLIVSNVGGLKEFVVNGYNGYKFDPGDYKHLHLLLKNMLKKSEFQNLEMNSTTLFNQKYQWESLIERYIDLFKNIVNIHKR